MKDSMQEWVGKNRPPRVQIQYDVEIGDAIELKELPFVVGIMANLSGKNKEESLKPLKERKFTNIDTDNFDSILSKIAPEATVQYDLDPEAALPKSDDNEGGSDGDADADATGDAGDTDADAIGDAGDTGADPKSGKKPPAKKETSKKETTKESKGSVNLVFRKMDDFNPGFFLEQIKPLKEIYESRCRLRDLQTKMDTNTALHEKLQEMANDDALIKSIKAAAVVVITAEDKDPKDAAAIKTKLAAIKAIDKVGDVVNLVSGNKPVVEGDKPKTEKETEEENRLEESAIRTIAKFANNIPEGAKESDVHSFISDRITVLEKALSAQLNDILHQKNFQEIEATWRGLDYLVNHTNTSTRLKLRVLNVSQHALWQDLSKAVGPKFDQSALFKKVYEEEYGTYGGDPYSLLVGDFSFNDSTVHVETLRGLAGVAAAAHAPFLAAVDPSMFGMETFADLSKPRDLSKIFESLDMAQWRALRDTEDARYLNLTMPRVLIRNLYGPDSNPIEQFSFEEKVDGKDPAKYLWANPAFVLAQRVTNAFYLYGWTAAIRGVEGGGLVENLPQHTFDTDDGDKALKCPTEIAITDRREKELTDLGFVAICHRKNTSQAAFFGSQSAKKPKFYSTNEANDNSRTSAMLPYLLAASRFAHYIKVIMRDKVGSFMTRANVEDYLNKWVINYVLLDDSADQETKAKYPLRDARIDVTDIPGKPGAYNAVVFLKPHFQLEELTTSIRLVAELPSGS